MGISVHSPWLPGYTDVTQTVLVILTMVKHFPEKILYIQVYDMCVCAFICTYICPKMIKGRCGMLTKGKEGRGGGSKARGGGDEAATNSNICDFLRMCQALF